MNRLLPEMTRRFLIPLVLLAALFSPGNAQENLLGGDPLGTDDPPFPLRTHQLQPTALWSDDARPLPTNAWWQNLVLGSGNNPVNVLPYLVRLDGDGLRFCLPAKTVAPTFVFSTFLDNLNFGAVEPQAPRTITDHGPLHVRVDWGTGPGSMSATLVRGMTYVTAHYRGKTPRVGTQHAIVSIDGAPLSGSVTGEKFEIGLNNGQTWAVYASSPITFQPAISGMTAAGPFDGFLRAAILDGSTDSLLDGHAGCVPTGGTVSATASGDTGSLVFDWETTGDGDLLQMALPHHLDVLAGANSTALIRNTIKGDMVGIVGDRWSMPLPLASIAWSAPRPVAGDKTEAVRSALAQDIATAVVAGDPYFGGKQMAALGRLALIAEELGENALAATYRTNLAQALESRLYGLVGDSLVYDQTWGGIVTASGISDPGAAFGQGYYNDHHFHYGYWIYAAAVLAKGDPSWVSRWGDKVRHLLRDIAEPSGADPHYPYLRNKDWFVGHSWAAGLFEFGDSRNQESTSEAVNAWYAVYLYGLATGDSRIRDLGRILLATEIRSARKYWQIRSEDDIYPRPFADNKVVGVLWGTKVDYATFFGANVEFIHGIQMLPFTPISEELLRPDWIVEEYPVLATALDNPGLGEGWRGFIHMARGVIDREAAWNDAQTLTGYDDGNSRSNTLYWLATRPERYANWKVERFGDDGDDPAIAGPAANPDDDDYPNLAEFAFDLDPGRFSASPLNFTFDSAHAYLTYPRRPASPDVTYLVEWSTDLQTWRTDGISLAVPPGQGNGATESVRATVPLGGATRVFLRVRLIEKG